MRQYKQLTILNMASLMERQSIVINPSNVSYATYATYAATYAAASAAAAASATYAAATYASATYASAAAATAIGVSAATAYTHPVWGTLAKGLFEPNCIMMEKLKKQAMSYED